METHAITAEIANQEKRLYEILARQEQARVIAKQCRTEIAEARAILAALRFAAEHVPQDLQEICDQDP